MAVTLACHTKAKDLLCLNLHIAGGREKPVPPVQLDPTSFEQMVMSTRTMDLMFSEPAGHQTEENKVGNRTKTEEALRGLSQRPIATRLNHKKSSTNSKWPLPHPLTIARNWLALLKRSDQRLKPGQLSNIMFQSMYNNGYENFTLEHEAAVVRAVCLLKMQEAVERADFHFDMVVRPQTYFLQDRVRRPLLNIGVYRDLGIIEDSSQFGMHTVVRRWLPLQSSRLAPFATIQPQRLFGIAKRQVHLPLRVQWTSTGEEGVDQGGLAQEFFQEIIPEVFGEPLRLFTETEENTGLYYPNPAAVDLERLQQYARFGVLLGLAIHNGFILPVQFPLLFYERIITEVCFLNDIIYQRFPHTCSHLGPPESASEEPEKINGDTATSGECVACLQSRFFIREAWPAKWRNLSYIVEHPVEHMALTNVYPISVMANPTFLESMQDPDPEICLDNPENPERMIYVEVNLGSEFAYTIADPKNDSMAWDEDTISLLLDQPEAQGEPVDVNDFNKNKYVMDTIDWMTFITTSKQTRYLARGLTGVIDPRILTSLSPYSFRLLVEGSTDISVVKLAQQVEYEGFDPTDDVIVGFWILLTEWPDEYLKKFLRFVTGSERLPISIGGRRNPPFTIRKNRSNDADPNNRLPSASTCLRVFDLPDYEDDGTLRRAMTLVIEEPLSFGKA